MSSASQLMLGNLEPSTSGEGPGRAVKLPALLPRAASFDGYSNANPVSSLWHPNDNDNSHGHEAQRDHSDDGPSGRFASKVTAAINAKLGLFPAGEQLQFPLLDTPLFGSLDLRKSLTGRLTTFCLHASMPTTYSASIGAISSPLSLYSMTNRSNRLTKPCTLERICVAMSGSFS